MISTIGSFIGELREVGLPISTAEALDAAAALQVTDIDRPEGVREALAATLVKHRRHRRAFDIAFDVFFGVGVVPDDGSITSETDPAGQGGSGGGDGTAELIAELVSALRFGDRAALRAAVRRAVSTLSGFQPGRPVGGRYYLYRVLQRLAGLEDALADGEAVDGLEARLRAGEVEALLEALKAELRREIVNRLVADRGPDAVAKTLREPLVEDLDLMHANAAELDQIASAVAPLARKLATRLAQRRRLASRGRPDVRRTIRRSLAHGGALVEPQFRHRRQSKPEIVLLCDVSGSMATFARFTMQLTQAMGNQFSRVRSFAFVDEVDEVTDCFAPSRSFQDNMADLTRNARVVGNDGHSDYGAVFRSFEERYGSAVTPRTTLIVTGDARNNYRDARAEVFRCLAGGARSAFWLNPESRRFWDTGDSIMASYRPLCDGVYEVRTLRQLERFVESVAVPSESRRLQRRILGLN